MVEKRGGYFKRWYKLVTTLIRYWENIVSTDIFDVENNNILTIDVSLNISHYPFSPNCVAKQEVAKSGEVAWHWFLQWSIWCFMSFVSSALYLQCLEGKQGKYCVGSVGHIILLAYQAEFFIVQQARNGRAACFCPNSKQKSHILLLTSFFKNPTN